MAMRIFTPQEFERELKRRSCERTEHVVGDMRFWKIKKNGELYFQVAEPHAMGNAYADWYLDYLIKEFGLPKTAVN